jgi:DNA mismatch repair protein MutS
VAQLAGIPRPVIAAAKRKLALLEQNQVTQNMLPQTDMFAASAPEVEVELHPVLSTLESLQADDLTPKQALDLVYKLVELAKS